MITQVSFYNILEDSLKTTARLVEKIYNAELSLLIFSHNSELIQSLNKIMWTFASKSFVPHGTLTDPMPEAHPILLGDNLQQMQHLKPDHTVLLFYNVNIAPSNLVQLTAERLIYVFDNVDTASTDFAREEYKKWNSLNVTIDYHKQQSGGGWN